MSSQVPIARFEQVNEDVPPQRTVAQVPVTGTTVDAVVSPDGRWVWRLSEEEDSALVTLLNGDTLETIDVFRPPDCDGDGLLGEWYEHTAVTSVHAPDMLVIFANAGDSFVLLLTLRATAEGIDDIAGPSMFEVVEPLLDEVIGYATFIAPDRLLVVDDIGFLILLSSPEGEVLARASVGDAFSTDEGYVVWPGDEPMDDLVIGLDSFATDGMILVSICGGDDREELLAFVALDVETLDVRGIIRPPVRSVAKMRQVESNRFVVSKGGKNRVMRLSVV